MPKELKRAKSIEAIRALLKNAIAVPSDYVNHPLAGVLKSQGRLAQYGDPVLGIFGCALNTFKRACIQLPGGYKAMNDLRLQALARILSARVSDPPKTTKLALRSRVQSLSSDLQVLNGDLLLLTRMLELALRHGRQYASDSRNHAIVERCRREQAEIRDMMTMRRTSNRQLKLVIAQHAEDA